MNLTEMLKAKNWAMYQPAFEAMIAAAPVYQPKAEHPTPAHGTGAVGEFTRIGGLAIIGLRGPIMQDDTYLSWLISLVFGGTVLESFKDSLHKAAADRDVNSILLDINSPGGEALGIEEAAQLIRSVNAKKPVTAFVDGMAASAAYWLGSAAGRLVLSGQSSQVGSIGVVLSMRDTKERDAAQGIKTYEVVSSQSPYKRVDPGTEEGMANLKAHVDRFAAVFIESVASFRGKSVDQVMAEFGKGDMVFAADALKAGMADAVLTRGELMQQLVASTTGSGSGGVSAGQKGTVMTQADIDAAVKAERERVAAIFALPEAKGKEKLAAKLAGMAGISSEDAAGILKEVPSATEATPLAAAMATVPNPSVGAGVPAGAADSPEAKAKEMLALAGGIV